jgi:uncharacterized surface anchored protein
VATAASSMMSSAARYAGPYTLHLQPQGTLQDGEYTPVTVTLTSGSGAGVPGIRVSMTEASGGTTKTNAGTTDSSGEALAVVSPIAGHAVTLTVSAAGLPATALRTVTPINPLAQRMVLPGGTSTAQAQITLPVGSAAGTGRLTVVKRAAGSGRGLAGVQFAVKGSGGRTVAEGQTASSGTWETAELAAGTYTLHEIQAAPGYTVAADRQVTVTAGGNTTVTVTDTALSAPGPAPRPSPSPSVPGGILPQTGA